MRDYRLLFVLLLVPSFSSGALGQRKSADQFMPDFPKYAVALHGDASAGVRLALRVPYRSDEKRLQALRGIEYALAAKPERAIAELTPLIDSDFEARKWLAFALFSQGHFERADAVIEQLDPTERDAWCLWVLGTRFRQLGALNTAARLCEQSLEQKHSEYVAQYLIRVLCESKRFGAVADVLNDCYLEQPALRGGYKSSTPLPSIEDMNHGKTQVKNLCRDRVELAKVIAESDSLRSWLVARFEGVQSGRKVFWSRFPLENRAIPFGACTVFSRPPMIWVDDGTYAPKPRRTEWQLSSLVYELLNVENLDFVIELHRRVEQQSVSKEKYIREMARLEYGALARTRAFFQSERIFELDIDIRPSDWRLNLPFSFNDYFALFDKDALYPYGCFGSNFDEVTSRIGLDAP